LVCWRGTRVAQSTTQTPASSRPPRNPAHDPPHTHSDATTPHQTASHHTPRQHPPLLIAQTSSPHVPNTFSNGSQHVLKWFSNGSQHVPNSLPIPQRYLPSHILLISGYLPGVTNNFARLPFTYAAACCARCNTKQIWRHGSCATLKPDQ